jgi:outer membrane protein assembly factor BamB
MASVDWNGDSVGDLVVQTGSASWVYDGTDGEVLYSQNLRATYGAYSAAAGNTTQGFSLVQSGAGALAFASQSGASVDLQIDPRRIESLPVVIGKQSRLGEERVFRINGTGDLAVYDKSGQLLQQEQWRAPVVAMTGAYVDEDASIDLLLSTSDGQLIAVSGKDLKEIWRVQLDGALGTPVASTLNGIDPVILVSSSRGVLYVLEN